MKIQAVPFKGAQYMCIEGSPRALLLREADISWKMGYDDLCLEIFQKALSSPGCAFEARESRASIDAALNAMAYHNACFEAAIGDEPRDGFGYDGND
jgi:hypothetical protein